MSIYVLSILSLDKRNRVPDMLMNELLYLKQMIWGISLEHNQVYIW